MSKVAILFCYIIVTFLLYYVFVFDPISLSLTHNPQFIMHHFSYLYLFLHSQSPKYRTKLYLQTLDGRLAMVVVATV